MCGIFGYVGRSGPDWDLMETVAIASSRRGPHGWGVAWVREGVLHVHREMGPLSGADWSMRAEVGPAQAVIGHSRLATSGAVGLRDAQPIIVGSVAVAHNGNVYRHRALATARGYTLTTDCDSELLAHVMEPLTPDGVRAAQGILGSTPYALAALDTSGRVAAGRRGQPLFLRRSGDGYYFGQVRFDGSYLMNDGEVIVFDGEGSTTTRPPRHPLSDVRWVDPGTLHANAYNPNRVFPPELKLLRLSILEDGWTQPVVVNPETMEIIDGFHRWTLASTDPEVRRVSDGLVPVVFVVPNDRASQQMATIRHNRARGAHGIVAMSEIVREIREAGIGDDEIQRRLGMEREEVDRLTDFRPSPDRVGQESFGRGWVPRK